MLYTYVQSHSTCKPTSLIYVKLLLLLYMSHVQCQNILYRATWASQETISTQASQTPQEQQFIRQLFINKKNCLSTSINYLSIHAKKQIKITSTNGIHNFLCLAHMHRCHMAQHCLYLMQATLQTQAIQPQLSKEKKLTSMCIDI